MNITREPLTVRHAETRDITVRTWTVRADTINEQERSIEAVLSTQSPVQVFDFNRFQVIDEVLIARGAEFPDQVVMLDNHMRFSNDAVIGSIRSMRIDGERVIGRLYFARNDDAADKIWNKVQQGHIRDVSIGYRSVEFQDIPPGQTMRVAGREWKAGQRTLRITTRYLIREGSVTPIGADQGAKMRADAGLSPLSASEGFAMNKALRKYLESLGLRAEASDAEAQAFWQALGGDQRVRADGIANGTIIPGEPAASPAPAAAATTQPVAQLEQRSSAVATPLAASATPVTPVHAGSQPSGPLTPDQIRAAEQQRITGIQSLRSAETRPEWIEHCIRSNLSVEHAGHYILTQERALRQPAVSGAPAGHVRDRDTDTTRMAMAGCLMMRTGTDPMILARTDAERRQWEERMNRGDELPIYSLFDFCREAVRMHDARLPDGSVPHTMEEMIRAAVSTPTLSYVFTTSVNARLLGAYDEAEPTIDWVEVVDVADFKQNEAISLSKGSSLEVLPRGMTAKHATYGDEQETYKIYRYAKQFAMDEQDIIDNNLDGFSSVLPELGMRAAAIAPDLVYYNWIANPTLAVDSLAVFHATHANTDTNPLSAANLKTGVTKMRLQTQGGVNLNIQPRFLIVAPSLEFMARELVNSATILVALAGNTDTSTERGVNNTIRDLNLQIRSDARLENGVNDPLTGTAATGAATKWGLASQPFRTARLAYRQGTGRRPQVRRYTLDRGQWGIGWDINLDIGFKFLGFRGLYRGNT